MNIWIDITNSPHVIFFEHMIQELQQGHKIFLTCRPLSNTIELLDLSKFTYDVIGKHYGQNIARKICGFPIRVVQLYNFLRNKRIDIAISHSSFYSPLVAKLIGARCIYLNDNEHAAGNRLSFIFADSILIPEFLDKKKILSQWGRSHKIVMYPGVKEGIYLWKYKSRILKKTDKTKEMKRRTIYIRPEPLTAQYYKGQQNFMDDLLIGLKGNAQVVLLPRSKDQKNYYRQEKFKHIRIPEKSVQLAHIFNTCDLFIGAGGTMTREAAVLVVPTISIYQDDLLDVDKYMINNGFMIHHKEITAERVLRYLSQLEQKPPSKVLLKKGKKAYRLIKKLLLDQANYTSVDFT
jgi:predicted glycosyltransferase